MSSLYDDFIKILCAYVQNQELHLQSPFTTDQLEKLFEISRAHDVIQIVSEVLYKNNLLPQDLEITKKFQHFQINALYRYVNISREQESIYSVFEANGIDFIPLKGAVMRQYYPDPYMRTSCDIDILVNENVLLTAKNLLVDKLGYKANETIDFHDISLFSPGGVHLELHYNLKEKRDNLDKQLIKVWDYACNANNANHHKNLTPEFFVFHHISHMVNHFLRGGCGIRSFVDLYYIKRNINYDPNILSQFLKESNIETFFKTAMHCVSVWFENEKSDKTSNLIKDFVLHGGTYGTKENRISVDQHKQGGRCAFILSRIFIPYDTLKYKYKILEKHKYLLPVMWIVRLITLISPEKRKRAQREFLIQQGISSSKENNIAKMMDFLQI